MNNNTIRYLKIVEKIADKICDDALWCEKKCNWVGVFHDTQIANAKTVIRALPSNFYNGSAGVAYFLSAAYQQLGKERYKKTALGALEKTFEQLIKINIERIGFYEGLSGIAYTFFQASKWLGEHFLEQKAKTIIDNIISNKTTTEWSLEAQDGCPSAIPTLIVLNQYFQDPNLDDLIEHLGNFILTKATKTPRGWYWLADNNSVKSGYAHGLAGISHALSALYIHTRNPLFLEALEQAIEFENSFYKPTKDNSAWCVGSIGVGFSRGISYQSTGKKEYLKEIKIMLKNSVSVSAKRVNNFSLCHGFFGDMSFIRWANEHDFVTTDKVNEKINKLLDHTNDFEKPLPDSKGFYLENPSFMLGWAGIGYFFLQLSYPTSYPETLLISNYEVSKEKECR